MIPRFSNPHLLPENAKRVSRAEIAIDDGLGHSLSQEVDLEVVEHLNHLLKRALPEPTQEAEPKRKKRCKVKINEVSDPIPDKPTLFRLVSRTLPPIQLSLEPPPPPPPITVEPDCEDNEIQAQLRKQQAESASVDFQWLMLESQQPKALRYRSKLKKCCVKAHLPEHPPPMAIIQSVQQPRKSRPPVPVEHYPYVIGAAPPPTTTEPARSMDCPVVEIKPELVRNKRRRSKVVKKERLPPRFWAPNPHWRGKCCGYAYGYPSHFATYENRFVD
ncbi:uncharacterized protein LACBIDRAFT_297289 [Laccaria bicolor S238N-H82]|uniref:Uncharacterized protein n=1 Tax=Laccaria bicolor (strain S238N-H82 / ATCC MYA-4686) TaxID=486041 RepID=B0DAG1_LACBS|nr:uncharacterized protein LACBIDRAFT_297289 [Laccaria bicolor S238N-H82]EDR08744.1 hypothetical protein LACBIDRAFT_297289 [Laccaria bicolor S238N-H82]|eukprot:XP_001880969.1 hypothetical protein LACBIDRAFT_297289 [Laccaria bicolor S238N-H82]